MYLIHLFVCTQSLTAVAAFPLLPLIPHPSRNSLYPYLALPYCFGMPTSKDCVLIGLVSNTLCHLGPVPLPFFLHLASTPHARLSLWGSPPHPAQALGSCAVLPLSYMDIRLPQLTGSDINSWPSPPAPLNGFWTKLFVKRHHIVFWKTIKFFWTSVLN